ncbi:hypothetical protein [Lysobacter sp. CA199]
MNIAVLEEMYAALLGGIVAVPFWAVKVLLLKVFIALLLLRTYNA